MASWERLVPWKLNNRVLCFMGELGLPSLNNRAILLVEGNPSPTLNSRALLLRKEDFLSIPTWVQKGRKPDVSRDH